MSWWSMHPIVKNTLKITGAGATIFAVGFAVLTFGDSDGAPVQEARADIWSLSFGGNDNQKRFVDALVAEGMEDPRAFDWNGNTVFFSTMLTDDSPVEVLRKFQDRFVEQGLNKKAHYTVLPPLNHNGVNLYDMSESEQRRTTLLWEQHIDQKDDLFTGGVVPTLVTESQVQMAGTEMAGSPKDSIDFVNQMAKVFEGGGTLSEQITSMRYVDAFRTDGGKTRVTATWSDDEFDMRAFLPEEQRPNEIVSAERTIEIPKCLGCKRLMYFEGLSDADRGYANEIFQSPQGATETLMFYDEALRKRGWKMADSSRTMLAAKRGGLMKMGGGQLLHYARGKDFLSLVAYPEATGSTVQVFESP